MHPNAVRFAVLCVAASLSACSGQTVRDGTGSTRIPDFPGDAVPRQEPRSKYGNVFKNGPHYEVLGNRYTVIPSSSGYRERGVASWYGNKFHGKLTSNREVYDMYAMTAAHKTLPLPTYVRVRNLRNNSSVVVRVNDRGPFVNNRIIDLSYAAASKLDMVSSGTSLVEVTAISFDKPQGDRMTRNVTPAAPPPSPKPAPQTAPETASQADPTTASDTARIFVQVGAFGDKLNANRRLKLLSREQVNNAFIFEDISAAAPLYRVRIGPISGVTEYDRLVETLKNLSINDPYLIRD